MNVAEAQALAGRADHWQHFADFGLWESASGGPDPQLAMVTHMAKDCDLMERAWRIGCYGAVYNVPGAEVLWRAWSWPQVQAAQPQDVESWVEEHFQEVPFRRERRAVRSRVKLARYLNSYADWMAGYPWQQWKSYDDGWRSLDEGVWGAGRYIIMKMLELYARLLHTPTNQPDLRAQGGWSPRATLGMLFPTHAEALIADTTKVGAALAESTALQLQKKLAEVYDVRLSMYDLQVVLCEYRESYVSKRQYPGRSLDSELKHHAAAGGRRVLGDGMFDTRLALFPKACLGELQGWSGTREDLGAVVSLYGYTWSDIKLDYQASRRDLSMPVRR